MRTELLIFAVAMVAFSIGFFFASSTRSNPATSTTSFDSTPSPSSSSYQILLQQHQLLLQQHQVLIKQQLSPNTKGNCPPCPSNDDTSGDDKLLVVTKKPSSSSSSPSRDESATTPVISPSRLKNDSPFFKDLPESFLTKVANPDSPVSILRGGQPKCLAGLSGSTKTTKSSSTSGEDDESYDNAQKLKNFREVSDATMKDIGLEVQDDKVVLHRYQYGYDAYLGFPCLRKQSSKIKMMEIGLGCAQGGHHAGPRSPALWGKFLPNAQYTVVEYSAECAKEWDTDPAKRKLGPTSYYKVYQGDQSDFNRWKQLMKEEAANMRQQGFSSDVSDPPMYDLIIDDGGHTMLQQVNSFLALWPHVKPGGVYIIEDFQTNWYKIVYGGSDQAYGTSHLRHSKNLVKHLMDRVHTVATSDRTLKYDDQRKSGVYRVDCTHYMCAIVKRWK